MFEEKGAPAAHTNRQIKQAFELGKTELATVLRGHLPSGCEQSRVFRRWALILNYIASHKIYQIRQLLSIGKEY